LAFGDGFRRRLFENNVEATLQLADKFYSAKNIEFDTCYVVCFFRHLEHAKLIIPGMLGSSARVEIKKPEEFIQIPQDYHELRRDELASGARKVADYFGRILRDYYQDGPTVY
jgi:hypothetical protein